MDCQLSLNGQFDESSAVGRLRGEQRSQLATALAAAGLRPKHTAYQVAMLAHNVAVGDHTLRWSAKRIAKDSYVNRSIRSVRDARNALAAAGLVELVPVKSIDGGDDIKAVRLNRPAIAAIAAGRNLQGERHPERHPERQGEIHPERQGERQGENSGSLYRTKGPLNQEPLNQEPSSDSEATKVVDDVGDFIFDRSAATKVAEQVRKLSRTTARQLPTELIWEAACLQLRSGFDAYTVAEAIGSGSVHFPRKYLAAALEQGRREAVP